MADQTKRTSDLLAESIRLISPKQLSTLRIAVELLNARKIEDRASAYDLLLQEIILRDCANMELVTNN